MIALILVFVDSVRHTAKTNSLREIWNSLYEPENLKLAVPVGKGRLSLYRKAGLFTPNANSRRITSVRSSRVKSPPASQPKT